MRGHECGAGDLRVSGGRHFREGLERRGNALDLGKDMLSHARVRRVAQTAQDPCLIHFAADAPGGLHEHLPQALFFPVPPREACRGRPQSQGQSASEPLDHSNPAVLRK